jgi:hypothetical protein
MQPNLWVAVVDVKDHGSPLADAQQGANFPRGLPFHRPAQYASSSRGVSAGPFRLPFGHWNQKAQGSILRVYRKELQIRHHALQLVGVLPARA